jgi:hypothetical protein
MGGNWYCRAKDAMFEVPKPLRTLGVGVDALPEEARNSTILTGNDLGILGNVERVPTREEVIAFAKAEQLGIHTVEQKHIKAKELIAKNEVIEAWNYLLL